MPTIIILTNSKKQSWTKKRKKLPPPKLIAKKMSNPLKKNIYLKKFHGNCDTICIDERFSVSRMQDFFTILSQNIREMTNS